ncbi:hypothetical protein ACWDF6_44545, partial [Streptomyces sp. NPDC001155]
MADARYGRLAAGPGRPEHAAGLPQCSAVRHRKGGLPEDSAVRPVRAACRKDAAVAPAGGSPETLRPGGTAPGRGPWTRAKTKAAWVTSLAIGLIVPVFNAAQGTGSIYFA